MLSYSEDSKLTQSYLNHRTDKTRVVLTEAEVRNPESYYVPSFRALNGSSENLRCVPMGYIKTTEL